MLGGILGFLPVLGFWMIPLGIAILAIDIPAARRAWRTILRNVVRVLHRVRGPKGRRR